MAARFGLGVLLFALLLDVGRTVAGTAPAVRGNLSPHQHQAQPRADARYSDLQSAFHRYIEGGTLAPGLVDHVRKAASARGLETSQRQALVHELQEAGLGSEHEKRPLAVRLLSGSIVSLGLGLTAATLAETLGMAVVPPVLLVTGSSVAMLQWRAQAAGARWTGLALGLIGTLLFGLGALTVLAVQPGLGAVMLLVSTTMLAGTGWATWHTSEDQDPWALVETELEDTLTRLRRAFLITLVSGLVLFPLEPLLANLVLALGGPRNLGLEVLVIAFATVTAFLAIEGVGTWLALRRGRRQVQRTRQRRQQATDAVLTRLDEVSTAPTEVAR